MDAGPTLANPPATTNNTTAASPTTSNASVLSATVVNAQPQPSSKKKQGRGPGKKDIKDKPAVSVRWDDGDLTDRLIAAVENNDRWLGVFAQSSNDPNAARTAAPVAKRDLQREIARYLFGKDPRYDLDDRKVLESLAVSVKNKLFKLTTLYTECKQELGQLSSLKDERELIPGSDAAATWARVKEKFPQFTRIRELMGRVSTPGSTPRASGPDASASPPHVRHSPTSPVLRQRDTNVVPLTNGQVPHRTLKGAVDFPRDASYTDPSSIPSAQYATGPAPMSITTIPSPTSYTISHSTMPLSAGYPTGHSSQRRMTSSSTAPPNSSRPSTAVSQAASARQHSPQHFTSVHTATSAATARPTPYSRPSLPATTMNEIQAHLQTALDIVPEYDDPRDPSPPLSATIQHIVTVLTERKERERSRAHELEMLRMKREEADKSRWHQREMMRLKIQLLRAERAASANPVSSSTPGAGPSQLGGVEEDLAIAAGLGDDMSMEGDGEGELDEDIYDPEPGVRPGQPLAHHGGAGTR
ncbi:hypothetical protein FRC04_006404 [Tulasnella sp. 424]|nr:hypothetical protein FRC04_006404 [Tulasnella sp. 424]